MAVMETTARITRKYLMNKDKHGICDVVFLLLDENDRLRAQIEKAAQLEKARRKRKAAAKRKIKETSRG